MFIELLLLFVPAKFSNRNRDRTRLTNSAGMFSLVCVREMLFEGLICKIIISEQTPKESLLGFFFVVVIFGGILWFLQQLEETKAVAKRS